MNDLKIHIYLGNELEEKLENSFNDEIYIKAIIEEVKLIFYTDKSLDQVKAELTEEAKKQFVEGWK